MAVSCSASTSSAFQHGMLSLMSLPVYIPRYDFGNEKVSCRPVREVFLGLSTLRVCTKTICTAYPTRRKHTAYPSRRKQPRGVWEEPDDGSDSEYEDDEAESEMEENNMDFESDWEEDLDGGSNIAARYDSSSVIGYEEDLVKEVEQLLGPEEKAILQENSISNLDKISTAKWIPLHSLALAGQIPFIDELIENGVDIDAVDQNGCTALHKAIIGKKEAVVSHLLRKGADPHVRDKDGATPLHYAVQVSARQTVKLLIKCKVDVNAADNEGWTPLHIAMLTRNRDIGKILLVNGADKTRRNKDGTTPLDLSICYGKDFKSYDLAKMLKLTATSDRNY